MELKSSKEELPKDKAGMKWICFEDFKPELKKDILVTDGLKIYTGYYDIQQEDYYLFDNRWSYIMQDMKYWMPLPLLPDNF